MNEADRRIGMTHFYISILVMAVACGAASRATAENGHAGHTGPADYAPIGVMGDHPHQQGGAMLSYRYIIMRMKGLRDDAERISRSEVLQDFMVTPTSMDMEMHMFGVMYTPIERLTLMLMLPFVRLEMDHQTRTGGTFTTRSDGIGDIRATALVDLWRGDGHEVHANLGISFPSGSISEQDKLPNSMGVKVRIPYPMQLGSGSYDLLLGVTYTGHAEMLSWGAQVRGEIRLSENHAGYRLGNEYALTAWGALELARWVSASFRLEWQHILNIRGRDESSSLDPIAPPTVPTKDPGRQAAQRLNALAGFNVAMPNGPLSGTQFAVEVGLPVYQHLDGPGLETDWIATAGLRYTF